MRSIVSVFQERKVLWLLIKRELRVRYANSFLGYLWTIIDPLANALIYFMIFVVIFQRGDAGHQPYFLFLLAGLLPWQWFNGAVSESTRALLAERQLVVSTSLPRQIWVIKVVISKGIEFVFSLPVLILFVAIYMALGETRLDIDLVFFPLAILMTAVLCIGFGLILAPLTVLVVDIQPTVRIFLRVFFYMTPIIFNLELLAQVPDGLRWIFQINPLTGILELYRGGFFEAPIRWHVVGYSAVGTALMFIAGLTIFRRLEREVLKEI